MRRTITLLLAFVLMAFPAVALAESAAQLLYNGDFSIYAKGEALPAGWTYDAWNAGDSTAYWEDGAVVIKSDIENDARIIQTVAVEPSCAYEITCEAWANDILGTAGAAITVLNTFASSEELFDAEDWTMLTLTGTTGPKQTELTIALRIGGYGELSAGEAGFRNVTMKKLNAAPAGALSFQAMEPTESSGFDAAPIGVMAFVAMTLCAVGMGIGAYYVYERMIRHGDIPQRGEGRSGRLVAGLLVGGFVFRVVLSLLFRGHSTDISCFMAWANAMAEYGPGGFYTSGMFADYPPGYMYVLWIAGAIRRLVGLSYESAIFILLLKLPSILADLFLSYLVYRLAKQAGAKENFALVLLCVVAFNPAMAFISGGWGQIDQFLTLLIVITILLFQSNHKIWAGAVFGLAILVKPQALMAGPVLAAAYLYDLRGPKQGIFKRILTVLGAVSSAVAVILLLALPFAPEPGFQWLLEKYFSTATSYPYASVEAFNLMALFGGNWKPVSDRLLFFSFGTWGTIFIVLSVLASCALYIRGKTRGQGKGLLPLATGFLLIALFTLGQYMHERYLFPALFLLLLAFLYYDDRRLFFSFAWFSVSLLLNSLAAFVIVDAQHLRGSAYDILTYAGSFFTVAGFGYLASACFDIVWRGNTTPSAMHQKAVKRPNEADNASAVQPLAELPEAELPGRVRLRFTRKDRLYCLIVTAVYGVISLVNLGSFTAPQTFYESATPGEQVSMTFEEPVDIESFWVFGGLNEGSLLLTTDQGQEALFEQENGSMFRWKVAEEPLGMTKTLTLTTYAGTLWINELAFFDTQGNLVTPKVPIDQPNAAAMFDEQNTVPEYSSSYNGMYFDELYHARTAYEHLHNIKPYENSHPPLGKVIIMLGVALFGMTPFGWRIMGALAGIIMVPLLYAFARRLFGKPDYALLAAGLFAFDFMHFTQTRIATIDSFSVLFIIFMYYFMYQYYTMSFYGDGLKNTLKPLGLAGLFFGLGASTKWICIYAGGGLAVILFLSLYERYREFVKARKNGETLPFWKNTVYTLLWCCLFYIVVPVSLYLLSYLPYYFAQTKAAGGGLVEYCKLVWDYQKFMWNYHSGLDATHPYQSSWWQWPFTLRPMWYCWNEHVPQGMISTLTASGNPAVWWVSTLGTLALLVRRLMGKVKRRPGMTVLFIGLAANFLPWVLVTRCTFIYHFFASVPFILLLAVYALQEWERREPRVYWVKWAWLFAAILLFLLLYPGLSGLPIPATYGKFLKLIPGGNLMYGA